MLFHDYLALSRQYYTFCSNPKAVPPVPPIRTWWGGDRSRGIYRKSRGISPGARGGDQSRGIENTERETLSYSKLTGEGEDADVKKTLQFSAIDSDFWA